MGKGGYNGGSTVIHAGSSWFGRGSVTSQPGEKKKRPPADTRPKRKKKGAKVDISAPKKGSGLTIAEITVKAEQKVRALESDITKTKQRLASLERDLTRARSELDTARNLPRKTALGAALHEAEKAKTAPQTPKSGRKRRNNINLSEAERQADREARENFRNAPKAVDVEHRAAGKLVGKRVVTRS